MDVLLSKMSLAMQSTRGATISNHQKLENGSKRNMMFARG